MLYVIFLYHIRTKKFIQLGSVFLLFIPIAILIDRFNIILWLLLSIGFLHKYYFHPLRGFPESTLLLYISNFNLGTYVMYVNLLMLIWLNVGYVVSFLLLLSTISALIN